MVTTPRLDVSPDPDVWFIGPSDERDFEAWLPRAVELLKTTFGVKRKELEVENYLTQMLARIGRPDDSPLPYRLIRWLDLHEMPFVASFGLAMRAEVEDHLDEFLFVGDSNTVEKPIVEDVACPEGTNIRRAVSYSQDETALLVEVRYVIDTGDPEMMTIVHAANRGPGEIMGALTDLDVFARAVRITRAA